MQVGLVLTREPGGAGAGRQITVAGSVRLFCSLVKGKHCRKSLSFNTVESVGLFESCARIADGDAFVEDSSGVAAISGG